MPNFVQKQGSVRRVHDLDRGPVYIKTTTIGDDGIREVHYTALTLDQVEEVLVDRGELLESAVVRHGENITKNNFGYYPVALLLATRHARLCAANNRGTAPPRESWVQYKLGQIKSKYLAPKKKLKEQIDLPIAGKVVTFNFRSRA